MKFEEALSLMRTGAVVARSEWKNNARIRGAMGMGGALSITMEGDFGIGDWPPHLEDIVADDWIQLGTRKSVVLQREDDRCHNFGRNPDWERWVRQPVWSIREGAFLICGREPFGQKGDEPEDIANALFEARLAVIRGSLKRVGEDPVSVNPKTFVRWALSREFAIPVELECIARDSQSS